MLLLNLWDDRVKELIKKFPYISFTHIFRQFNIEAHKFSKRVVGIMDGIMFFEDAIDERVVDSGSVYIL